MILMDEPGRYRKMGFAQGVLELIGQNPGFFGTWEKLLTDDIPADDIPTGFTAFAGPASHACIKGCYRKGEYTSRSQGFDKGRLLHRNRSG
jgi:hypothetical protein